MSAENTYWVVQVKEVRPEAQLTLEQAKAGGERGGIDE